MGLLEQKKNIRNNIGVIHSNNYLAILCAPCVFSRIRLSARYRAFGSFECAPTLWSRVRRPVSERLP